VKRFLCIILTVLTFVSLVPVYTFASEAVGYISYNKGKDSNNGLSDAAPKKSIGSAYGNGAFSIVKNGGTLVVCEKMYIGIEYTWKATAPTTITASYGGKDYRDATLLSNPASGVFKSKPRCPFNVASDLVFDSIILQSEDISDTIVVKKGATLTITDSVLTTTRSNTYYKIVVEEGAKAIIKAGTYTSVSGDGEIELSDKVVIASGGTVDKNGAVGYISYNGGKNTNDGYTDKTPKSSIGSVDGSGVLSLVRSGGTIVVSEKLYVSSNYTFSSGGKVIITANYGGKDYKNTLPATNPTSGVIKFKQGITFTVGSDLVLDDVILFQENEQCNIVVSPGVTLTINESVITMSNRDFYMNIIVSKGATAIINGGTYSHVSGEGTIRLGSNVKVLEEGAPTIKKAATIGKTVVCYLDYDNGNNNNSGSGPDDAVKSYAAGLFKRMAIGGTVVVSGNTVIGGSGAKNEYALPGLAMPITFTSVYDGVDYKTSDRCNFGFTKGTTFVIGSDVTFDSIALIEKEGQSTIRVTNGATLTVTDNAVFASSHTDGAHYKIIVEKGSYAILSAEAQKTFTVEGEGTVITYEKGAADLFKHFLGKDVELPKVQ